jgi:hypothetical protein
VDRAVAVSSKLRVEICLEIFGMGLARAAKFSCFSVFLFFSFPSLFEFLFLFCAFWTISPLKEVDQYYAMSTVQKATVMMVF